MHELNETAKKWRKANKAERPKLFYNGADNEKYKEQIEVFGAACSAVMNVYFFYHNIFMPALKAKKNCSGYAEENLEKLIDQMYDQEHAERIIPPVKRSDGRKTIWPFISFAKKIAKIRRELLSASSCCT